MTRRARQLLAGGVMVTMAAFGIGGCGACFHHFTGDDCEEVNTLVSADLCEVPV